jgi:hypothetical protein
VSMTAVRRNAMAWAVVNMVVAAWLFLAGRPWLAGADGDGDGGVLRLALNIQGIAANRILSNQ